MRGDNVQRSFEEVNVSLCFAINNAGENLGET